MIKSQKSKVKSQNYGKTISIIGVGLIGGSLGLALKELENYRLIGIGRNTGKLKTAKKIGAVDEITTSFKDGVKDADFVVLCTPVKTCIEIAKKIKPFLKKNTIIFDVGSTKLELVQSLQKIFNKNIHFIGCHPVAGSEKSGVQHAKKNLYKNTICVITPTNKTNKNALKIVEKLWNLIGAKIIQMSPSKHDELLAITSHFPHISAISLIHLLNQSKDKNLIPLLIGNGFRDTTRIAGSSSDVWINICQTNRKNLIELCQQMKKYISKIEDLLQKENWKKLDIEFEKAKKLRDKITHGTNRN